MIWFAFVAFGRFLNWDWFGCCLEEWSVIHFVGCFWGCDGIENCIWWDCFNVDGEDMEFGEERVRKMQQIESETLSLTSSSSYLKQVQTPIRNHEAVVSTANLSQIRRSLSHAHQIFAKTQVSL